MAVLSSDTVVTEEVSSDEAGWGGFIALRAERRLKKRGMKVPTPPSLNRILNSCVGIDPGSDPYGTT